MTFSLKTGNIDETSFPLVFHVIRIASKYILAIFVYFAKKFTSESILFFPLFLSFDINSVLIIINDFRDK